MNQRVIPLILSTESSNSRSETELLMSYKFKMVNLVTDLTLILTYQVHTLFAVGSPLGVFLALRNIRIGIGNPQYTCMIEILMSEYSHCCDMTFREVFCIFVNIYIIWPWVWMIMKYTLFLTVLSNAFIFRISLDLY